MKLYLTYIVPNIILAVSAIIVWKTLLNKEINYKSPKIYIAILFQSSFAIFNYFTINKFVRIMLITILFMFVCRYLFKENIRKTILTPIFYQIIVFVSELLVFIIVGAFLKETNAILFFESFIGIIIINFLVSIVSILIAKLKLTKIIYKKLINITNKLNRSHLLFLCLIMICFFDFLVINVYYKLNFIYWLIINILLISVLFLIILFSFKTQNKFNKVSDKYNVAIKSLNNYESMMTKYRITNHENKNLLLTIRAMILNKEKDIPKYIDSMLENKYNDDEKLLFDMSVIPTGGLRATIYSEVMKIIDNKIDYNLYIDKKIKTIDLIELDTDTIIDICKIIGVFIDNAIDEVKKLKNKNIDISLYIEEKKLCIKVSNNYKGKIELDKLFDEGYSTKGKNHGYGLSMVKNIIKENKDLENKIEINKDLFSQIILIQYKKSHK